VERLEIDDDAFMRFSLTKANITDFGLAFFFEVLKDLVISKEFIETLYRVVIKIARTKLKPLHQVPEMPQPDAEGNEPSEEAKVHAQRQIDEVAKLNAEIEKHNEEVSKIQSKVKIAFRPMQDVLNRGECALMRVNNFRDAKLDETALDQNASVEAFVNTSQQHHAPSHQKQGSVNTSGKQAPSLSSQRDQLSMEQDVSALDNFQLEDVPAKMILLNPHNDERDVNLIVYHSGKPLWLTIFRGPVRAAEARDRGGEAALQGAGEAEPERGPSAHRPEVQAAGRALRGLHNQDPKVRKGVPVHRQEP